MPTQLSEADIDNLTVAERLDLIGKLWDSLPEAPPMPAWHREEIDRRLRVTDTVPDTGIPWEQVKARLRQRP